MKTAGNAILLRMRQEETYRDRANVFGFTQGLIWLKGDDP